MKRLVRLRFKRARSAAKLLPSWVYTLHRAKASVQLRNLTVGRQEPRCWQEIGCTLSLPPSQRPPTFTHACTHPCARTIARTLARSLARSRTCARAHTQPAHTRTRIRTRTRRHMHALTCTHAYAHAHARCSHFLLTRTRTVPVVRKAPARRRRTHGADAPHSANTAHGARAPRLHLARRPRPHAVGANPVARPIQAVRTATAARLVLAAQPYNIDRKCGCAGVCA